MFSLSGSEVHSLRAMKNSERACEVVEEVLVVDVVASELVDGSVDPVEGSVVPVKGSVLNVVVVSSFFVVSCCSPGSFLGIRK